MFLNILHTLSLSINFCDQFNFVRGLSWSISSIFHRKFTLKWASQPKIAKNALKPIFLGFKLGHRCWYPWKARQQCLLVVIMRSNSKSVSICNRSRARLVDSSRNRTFLRGYPNFMHSYGGPHETRGSKLALLKSNAENFICRLSWSISSDFDAVHS